MHAATLQEMIALMIAEMAQKTDQIVHAQNDALEVVTRQVRSENELIMLSIGAMMTGAVSLQEQLVSYNNYSEFKMN